MSDLISSTEHDDLDLLSLRREVSKLKAVKIIFDVQNELLKTFVSMARTTKGHLMLKAVLQQALTISSKLTRTEESSLFLLDVYGTVTESILARGVVIREVRDNLIGKVLDAGLAGWTIEHRKVGLIEDTTEDDRWLNLPGQPYQVGSALCVPIVKGRNLLGLITLTHSQPRHFNTMTARLMERTAEQIAIVIDIVQLYLERHELDAE